MLFVYNVLDIKTGLPKSDLDHVQTSSEFLVIRSEPHKTCDCGSDIFHLFTSGLYCAVCSAVLDLDNK